jgi:hypothetical protein
MSAMSESISKHLIKWPFVQEVIWLDYNPSQLFWADRELVPRDDVDFITVTYKDNDTLPQAILDEFKIAREKAKTSEYWRNFVNVYLEGQIGRLSDVVIPDWIEIPKLPEDARLLCYGLDWGYSIDESSCVALYKHNDAYIFDEVLYQKGMLNSNISQFLKTTTSMVSCGRIPLNQNQSRNCNRMDTQSTRSPKEVIQSFTAST